MRLMLIIIVSVFIAIASNAGCNSNPQNRQTITGTVTLDGKPIVDGGIGFEPVAGGIRSGTIIQNGRFTMNIANGLPPGEYKIEITASEEVPGKMVETMAGPMPDRRDIVPPDYSQGTHTVTIKADEKNHFQIDMKSKP